MDKHKILLLGASGFIGNSIYKKLSHSYEVYGTYCTKGDACDKNLFQFDIAEGNIKDALAFVMPDIIISSLRGDFEQQLELHKEVAEYIANRKDGKLIFLSTANVFDGDVEKPHYEDEQVIPSSEYGSFKASCENLLSEVLGEKCIILRIPVVWGKDCPRVEQLKDGEQVPSVTNWFVNITTIQQIADYVDEIIRENRVGIFHVGTSDSIDYYELQLKVCELLGIEKPEFQVEHSEKTGYQVMYTQRTELPDTLSLTVEEALQQLL